MQEAPPPLQHIRTAPLTMDEASLPYRLDLASIITTILRVGFDRATTEDSAHTHTFTRDTETGYEEIVLTTLTEDTQADGQVGMLWKYRPLSAVTDDQTVTRFDDFIDLDPYQWVHLADRLCSE